MMKYALHPASNDPARAKALNWYFHVLGGAALSEVSTANIILCTDITQKHTLARTAQSKAVNIDPLMAPDMAGDLNRAILKSLPFEKLATEHKQKFFKWQQSLGPQKQVNIYGPGPSGNLENQAGSLTIITGRAMTANALANNIHIDAVIISDSLAIASYGDAADTLRQQIHSLGCALITTLANAAILAPHWPQDLRHLLIGVPEDLQSKPGASLNQNFSSFPTGNVLTALILPIAASLKRPITLNGFEGALGHTDTSLAHQNTTRQNRHKLDMWRTHYGSGYLFGAEYLGALQADVNRHIHAYQASGVSISAPGWTGAAPCPQNYIKAKLYAGAAYADTHPVGIASLAALISTGFAILGLQIMTNLHWLILGIAAIGAFAFVFGVLHLRARAKRLADLAERRASEKSQRAFEATNQRLDALEAKLDK